MPTPPNLEDENKALRTQLIGLQATHAREQRSRDEAHARAIADHAATVERLTGSVKKAAAAMLMSEARAQGVRDEALPEIQLLLGEQLALDDDGGVFVKGADGSP